MEMVICFVCFIMCLALAKFGLTIMTRNFVCNIIGNIMLCISIFGVFVLIVNGIWGIISLMF